MSIVEAYRHHRSLTSEQVELLGTKQMRGSRTPGEWITFLAGVAAYDRTADSLRATAGWGIGLGLLLAFLSGVAVHSFIAVLVFLIIAVASFILFRRLKRDDIPNNMRECVLPLIALLREEIEPEEQLFLRFDLTGGVRREKQSGKTETLPPGNYVRGTESFYNDHWLEGETTFADGSNIGWSVTDEIRERDVVKRSSSGKIKAKKKFKVTRVLDVRVGMRQDAYALADGHGAGGRGHDRVAVKSGNKRNVMKIRRTVTESRPDAPLDPRHIFDLLAEAYKRVTLNQTEE